MFYKKEDWQKFRFNQKKIDETSFKLGIEKKIVAFYLKRNRETLLSFLEKDFPLYMEYDATVNINAAAQFLGSAFKKDEKTLVLYDCDLDGYGAMKILSLINEEGFKSHNIFYKEFWKNIPLFEVKDAKKVIADGYKNVIFLDMGQNSSDGLNYLAENGVKALVVDHHMQDFYAIPTVVYYYPNFKSGGYPSAAGLVYLLQREVKRLQYKDLDKTYIILDIETTGLNPGIDDILEISALKVKGGEITERFETFLKTDKKISSKIKEITGIDNNIIDKNGKDAQKVIKHFLKFIGSSTLVAHNANFDLSFIKNYLQRFDLSLPQNDVIDTLTMTKRFYKGLPSYALGSIVNSLNLYHGKFHRAKNDTRALYRLFLELLKKENNLRTFSRDESLLIYYITIFSDRMKIDGINYLFMRKIDIYLEFSEILGDSKYSGLLINSYYNYDKLIPVLNSKYRAGDYEEIDKFYKTKKLNIFKRKVYTGSSTKEALKVGRNLNPNGKIRVMLIDKKFTGKKGAIASELTKNIDAPTVILIQDNPLSGSSRFLNGNILEFFKSNGDLFRTFGGHGKAVGFTIDNFKIPQFIEKFEAWFKHFDSKFEPKKLFYDDILEINKIGEAEKKLVKLCGPYGKQIQAPTYLDTNVIVKGIRRYGKDGRSLFLELEKGNTKVYGISPYNGTYANELDVNEKYNILYNPMLKKYEDSNVIYIVDIRKIG